MRERDTHTHTHTHTHGEPAASVCLINNKRLLVTSHSQFLQQLEFALHLSGSVGVKSKPVNEHLRETHH